MSHVGHGEGRDDYRVPVRVASLHLHPVKSTAVRAVEQASVERAGPVGDRRWMVVDGDGAMLTARTVPRLLLITADVPATAPEVSGLRLRSPAVDGLHELELEPPSGDESTVQVFDDPTVGVDAGDRAAAWIGKVLGRSDVRLLFASRPTARHLDPDRSEPGDHTAYADGFPLLLCASASLARLNEWIAEEGRRRREPPTEPLPMTRFRPNLVVDGSAPFAEDHWHRVRVGSVEFRVAGPCTRCVLTTIDPVSLVRGKEPLRSLARHRRRAGAGVLFGQNLIPDGSGRIAVGDPVVVLG